MQNPRARARILRALQKPTTEELRKGLHARIHEAIAVAGTDPVAIRQAFEREQRSRKMSFLERENWQRVLGSDYLAEGIAAVLAAMKHRYLA